LKGVPGISEPKGNLCELNETEGGDDRRLQDVVGVQQYLMMALPDIDL
jgi:hypothetical protein